MKPLISILIINFKTERLTIELVSSIKKFVRKYRYEILIFDNSPQLSRKLNELSDVNIKIYSKGYNLGFVKANNFLFNEVKGELIFLINSDVVLSDNSFEYMVDFLLNDEKIGVIGPMLLNSDGTYQVSFYKFPTLISLFKEMIILQKKDPYAYKTDIYKIQTCEVIKGACLGFKRNTLPQNYLFDENFEMYSEEVDLCFRFHKSGFKNVYYPNCKVIHYGGMSSNSDENSLKYSTFNYFRSKLIFFKKHYSYFKYLIASLIIFISLIERIIIFSLLLKLKQVRIFWYTFSKLFLEYFKW